MARLSHGLRSFSACSRVPKLKETRSVASEALGLPARKIIGRDGAPSQFSSDYYSVVSSVPQDLILTDPWAQSGLPFCLYRNRSARLGDPLIILSQRSFTLVSSAVIPVQGEFSTTAGPIALSGFEVFGLGQRKHFDKAHAGPAVHSLCDRGVTSRGQGGDDR